MKKITFERLKFGKVVKE